MLHSISPLFIVADVGRAVAFYRDILGFRVTDLRPADDPFFAIVARDGVSILLKAIAADVPPQPNPARHEWARWDAMIATDDPDALHAEFRTRGATFRADLADTDDGLRAFEIRDADGYVLCFGRARTA